MTTEKIKLLIVDDSEMVRQAIDGCFDDAKFSLHHAAEGSEAIAKARQLMPEIVTMDLAMPEMVGAECIDQLIALNPDVKILVISALADIEACIESLKRGAVGFLRKPFSDDEIYEAINLLMEA